MSTLLPNPPAEELRLALVLNGGVSLAVWMGGVTHEINLLTRAGRDDDDRARWDDAGYGPILKVVGTLATVDVISGTSAGGINGAALAMAQVNQAANLLNLRDLWSEQGRLEVLLRNPFQGKPTSLLQGDDYFLPELNRALRTLAYPFTPRTNPAPIDLTLTTTLLTGAEEITIDDFGEEIPQRVHAAKFRFSNVDGASEDPFAADRIEQTAADLALAARCTASFPFAFEPAFVPVGEDPADQDPYRRRMDAYASWRRNDSQAAQSRYAVDGGVLANTPVTDALKAIARRAAEGPVRRAMLMVFPHAPQAAEVPADKASEPPTAVGALAGVLGALQSQGLRSFVERVDEHNRRAARWKGSQAQLLDAFGAGANAEAVKAVYEMLSRAWPHYRHVRIRIAAAGLADRVRPRPNWPYDRIRAAAEKAQSDWAARHDGALPYVPQRFAWDDREWLERFISQQDVWPWGDTASRGVAEAVASVLRDALAVVPDDATRKRLADARRQVGRDIAEIAKQRQALDAPWEKEPLYSLVPDQRYWSARLVAYGLAMNKPAAAHAMDVLDRLVDTPTITDTQPSDELIGQRQAKLTAFKARDSEQGKTIVGLVRTSVQALVDRSDDLRRLAPMADGINDLGRWCGFLFADREFDQATGQEEPADEADRVLLRLVALDAATRLLADETVTGDNLPVKLAELSLRTRHPWAQFSRSPDDKAAGLELSRFGGFLKRSWRMNDWIWGRLDAATMLCQLVLDPKRLQRLGVMTERHDREWFVTAFPAAVLAALKRDLYANAPLPAHLRHLEDAARRDLQGLCEAAFDSATSQQPSAPLPLYLPHLARWAALPIQVEIILEELPILAQSIALDVEDGAGQPTRGTRFLVQIEGERGLLDRIAAEARKGPLTADNRAARMQARLALGCEALAAFDSAGIGREPLADEVGSDSLIRTVSKTAGVVATVLDSDADGFRALKPVTKAIRGAALFPYWVIHGLAGGGTVARFLATAGLVVGGVLVVLSLFGILGGATATAGTIGAASLLVALAYSAARTGSLLHAVALLAPVGPLVAYAMEAGSSGSTTQETAVSRVLVVLLAAAGLYILASLPWPLQSPLTVLGRGLSRLKQSLVSLAHGLDRIPPRTASWIGRVGKLGILGLLAIGLVLAGIAGWRTWGEELWDEVRDSETVTWLSDLAQEDWPDRLPWLGVIGLAAVVGLGAFLAYWQGALLRTWRADPRAPTTYTAGGRVAGRFTRHVVRHPAGVAAGWAWVYGIGYLVAAGLLFELTMPGVDESGELGTRADWEVFSLWWLLVIGGLLCLVAPVVVTRSPRQRTAALLRRTWTQIEAETSNPGSTNKRLPRENDVDQRLLYALLKYDLAFDYLVSPGRRRVGRSRTRELGISAISGRRLRYLLTKS